MVKPTPQVKARALKIDAERGTWEAALADLDAALGLEAMPPGADIDERLQRETTRRARLVAAIRSLVR